MRFAVLAAVCFCMVVLATANDIDLGKREEGDVLALSRRLIRPATPGKRMIAKTGFNAKGTITAVKATNAANSHADVAIFKGGPGTDSVGIMAMGPVGEAIDVLVEIYATKPPVPAPEEPESI